MRIPVAFLRPDDPEGASAVEGELLLDEPGEDNGPALFVPSSPEQPGSTELWKYQSLAGHTLVCAWDGRETIEELEGWRDFPRRYGLFEEFRLLTDSRVRWVLTKIYPEP